MPRPLHLLLIVALACGLAVAGCGGSKKSSSKPSQPAANTTTQSSGTTTAASASSGAASSQIKAAVDACKQSVDAQATLSATAKADLKGLCDKAASGNAADVQKAAKEVCIKLIEDTVPAGDAQTQAKAACNQAVSGATGGGGGTSTSASSSSGGATPSNAQIQAAVASCKQSVQAAPTLSSKAKSDLESLCEKAASGDSAAVKDATKKVCVEIVKDQIPAGAAQDQALASCNK